MLIYSRIKKKIICICLGHFKSIDLVEKHEIGQRCNQFRRNFLLSRTLIKRANVLSYFGCKRVTFFSTSSIDRIPSVKDDSYFPIFS